MKNIDPLLLENQINNIWNEKEDIESNSSKEAINNSLKLLDNGILRVAEKKIMSGWFFSGLKKLFC